MSETTTLSPLSPKPRMDFMAGHGFVMYSDVSDRLIRYLTPQSIEKVNARERQLRSLYGQAGNGDFAAFYMVCNSLSDMIPRSDQYDIRGSDMHQVGGLTEADAEVVAHHTFGHGLDDRKFPWHFAGGLAATVAYSFVEAGKIEKEDLQRLTLSDWAGMISAKWFSRLSHNFARTGNGLLQSFGDSSSDYTPSALVKKLRSGAEAWPDKAYPEPDADEPLLIVGEGSDATAGITQWTAHISEPYREMLRNYRKNYRNDIAQGGSVGCPVARRFAQLPEEFVEADAHMERLQRIGLMTVHSADSEDGHALVGQSETAIDRSLAFIGWQLSQYDEAHGTPRIIKKSVNDMEGEKGFSLVHEKDPQSNLFVKPA